MLKLLISSADWEKTFKVQECENFEATLKEAATLAVEFVAKKGWELEPFIRIVDCDNPEVYYIESTYTALVNSGMHSIAKRLNDEHIKFVGVDLSKGSLTSILRKIGKKQQRKAFCVARVNGSDKVVCHNFGLFDERYGAKAKCLELNKGLNEKSFVVVEMVYNQD